MAGTGNTVAIEPYRRGVAITKSDATTYSPAIEALYIGGTGDVAVRGMDGNNYTLSGVPVGTVLTIQVDRVLSTGTTATNIVALYR